MSSSLPIGVFDSGIGGLSVLQHIREILPAEELIYIADRGHLPYGNKSHEYIVARSVQISEFLLAQSVKAIVVACNTATAAAVSTLRSRYSIPIIGMEPGLKPAIRHSKNGMIGILATEGTLGSGKFKGLVEQHANGAELFIRPCHGWVEQIESDTMEPQQSLAMVRETLAPLLATKVDTLVLGCTHYPFLIEIIRQLVGTEMTIIDTGFAVATHLKRRLREEKLLNDTPCGGKADFWCTGSLDEMKRLVDRFWEGACQVTTLPHQANLS